jgi:hypothetical protein
MHTKNHVIKALGAEARGLSDQQLDEKVKEFNREVDEVVLWASNAVKKKMIKAAARVDLRLNGYPVETFDDIKASWKSDGTDANIGKIYEICYGDYEGKDREWSRSLEIQYMWEQEVEYTEEPCPRAKGGYEMCITTAKGNLTRQVTGKSENTHKAKIVLSLKGQKGLPAVEQECTDEGKPMKGQERRKGGMFYLRSKASMPAMVEDGKTYFTNQCSHLIQKSKYREDGER